MEQKKFAALTQLTPVTNETLAAVTSDYVANLNQYNTNYNSEGWWQSTFVRGPWRLVSTYYDEDPLIVDTYWKMDTETKRYQAMAQGGAVFKAFQEAKLAEWTAQSEKATGAEKTELEELKKQLTAARSFVDFAKRMGAAPQFQVFNIPPLSNTGKIPVTQYGVAGAGQARPIKNSKHVSVNFSDSLDTLQTAYLEASYCTAYRAQRAQVQGYDSATQYRIREMEAMNAMDLLGSEGRWYNPTWDSRERQLEHEKECNFNGDATAYRAMLHVLQDNPDWKKVCAYKAAQYKGKPEAAFWTAGQLDKLITQRSLKQEWNGLEEKSDGQNGAVELGKIEPTAKGLLAAQQAEESYYLAANAMAEYRQYQKSQKEKGSGDNDLQHPPKPALTKKRKMTDAQALTMIERAYKALDKAKSAVAEQQGKLEELQYFDPQNATGIQKVTEELAKLQAREQVLADGLVQLQADYPAAWQQYQNRITPQKPKPAEEKGPAQVLSENGETVSVPDGKSPKKSSKTPSKTPGKSQLNRHISEEESQRIALAQQAQMQTVQQQKGFWGRAWDWVKRNWGWLLTGALAIGGAVWGIIAYKKKKDSKVKQVTNAVKTVTQTTSSSVNKANTVVNNVNKVTSTTTTLGTKVNAVDNINSAIITTMNNLKNQK